MNPSGYRPEVVEYGPFSTFFLLNGVRFSLSQPGKYNLYNALSCIAYLAETGTPLESIADVLHGFDGIDRRFDIYLNDGKHLVIDDYAIQLMAHTSPSACRWGDLGIDWVVEHCSSRSQVQRWGVDDD